MGRPAISIDESRIVELASKGYRLTEIAAMVGISYRTLHRRFGTACDKGHELMCGELRAKQLEVALKGNPVVLI